MMVGKKPRLSIIIPVYNEEKYIRACLDSLLNQTFQDFEIIIINDGSTDNTPKIIDEYSKKDNRIKIIHQKNLGQGISRNKGILLAKGEILAFPDGDMQFPRNYIEKMINPVIKKKEISTTHAKEIIINRDNIWARCWGPKLKVNKKPGSRGGERRVVRKDYLIKNKIRYLDNRYFDDCNEDPTKPFVVGVHCYHNNPSSLKEVFEMNIRVGRGFIQKPEMVKSYFKKYLNLFLFGLVSFLILFYYLYSLLSNYILTLFLTLFISAFLLAFVRSIKEKDPLLFFALPIFYLVRGLGLLSGSLRQLVIKD